MTTVEIPQEERVTLQGVSWETYESLLRDHEDSSAPRLTYDRGVLEVVSALVQHEKYSRFIDALVTAWADATDTPIEVTGSTTFRRKDRQCGFEPDASFYITHAAHIQGKDRIDLSVDPPPDVVVEIDLTHSSLDKLAINADLGVPEVWRYDGNHATILALEAGRYVQQTSSRAVPIVTDQALTALLRAVPGQNATAWARAARRWVEQTLAQEAT